MSYECRLSTAADLHIPAVNDLLRIDVVADNHPIKVFLISSHVIVP